MLYQNELCVSVFKTHSVYFTKNTHTHTKGRPCQIEHSEQIGLLFELTAYSCAMLTKEESFVS